jgi:hypothetical protein
VALVGLAAVVGAGVGFVGVAANLSADDSAESQTSAPSPATVEPSPSPSPSPSASEDPPPASLGVPFGQAAPPLRLEVGVIGVAAEVLPYTADHARAGHDGLTGEACYQDGVIVCVDPPTVTEVYWQRGGLDGVASGDMPGLQSRGTVYLYGHAGVSGTGAVFDALPSLEPGTVAVVGTGNGRLNYRVEEVFTVPKDQFTTDPRITSQVPGQLLLVSCDHSPGAGVAAGGYAVDNVVARLQIVSAGPPSG